MNFNEINRTYLYEGLTYKEKHNVKLWESAGSRIVEAELTADQITQLFKSVEQSASASGDNRTILGKGKDAASAVNKAWEDLKTKVQNSGPIKNVDAMYDKAADKLKQATGGDAGVMQYVQKYRDFAKKHPVAQSIIYSALIAAAGISGAGAGGAAALGLFKMVDKLLQGEKFSSAAYAGAKTGGAAYAAGQIGKAMRGDQSQAATDAAANSSGGVDAFAVSKRATDIVKEKIANGEVTDYNSYQDALDSAIEQAAKVGGKTASYQTREAARDMLGMQLDKVAAKAAGGQFNGSGPEKVSAIIKAFGGQVDQQKMGAAAQAAKSMATNESFMVAESQVPLLFSIIARKQMLEEGVWDSIKGAAGKVGSAIANKAKTVGSNLTNKVTADKLQSVWKKAGSPTDSNAIYNILLKAGASEDIVKQVFSDSGIEITNSTNDPKQAAQNTGANKPAHAPELVKPWIEYLKNNQIVAMQSDPKTGDLQYKRKVTTDDLKKFLAGASHYSDNEVNAAISQVVGNKQPGSSEEPQNKAPSFGQPAPAPSKVTYKGIPGKAPLPQASTNTQGAYSMKSAVTPTTKTQPAQQAPAPQQPQAQPQNASAKKELSQTPNAIRKRNARAKAKQTAPVTEGFKDLPSQELSEDDIEAIFAALATPKEQPQQSSGKTNTGGPGAFGQMASQLGKNTSNTMANTPVSKVNKAKPGNPNLGVTEHYLQKWDNDMKTIFESLSFDRKR